MREEKQGVAMMEDGEDRSREGGSESIRATLASTSVSGGRVQGQSKLAGFACCQVVRFVFQAKHEPDNLSGSCLHVPDNSSGSCVA